MSTVSETPSPVKVRKPRAKPKRFIRWLVKPVADGGAGVVQITVGKVVNDYAVRELPCDLGAGQRGFELTKLGPDSETYHVLLDTRDGKHTCECKGFGRWNHCKHTEGLLVLLGIAKPVEPSLDAPNL
jgi:hypothetical protein